MATSTPWGASQSSTPYGRGIVFYETAGHGGFHVARALNATIPDYLRRPDGWYEEDCDWARVVTAFPDRFSPAMRDDADWTLRSWAPDVWEQHTGRTIEPGQSYIRDKQRFRAAHMDDFVAVAAWGDWHADVPPGMIGVCARRERDGVEQYVLVPTDEYHAHGHFHFVIDPERHRKVERII